LDFLRGFFEQYDENQELLMKTLIRVVGLLLFALKTFAMEISDPDVGFSTTIAVDFIGNPCKKIDLVNLFAYGKEHGLLRISFKDFDHKKNKSSLVIKIIRDNHPAIKVFADSETNAHESLRIFISKPLVSRSVIENKKHDPHMAATDIVVLYFRLTDDARKIFLDVTTENIRQKVQKKGAGLNLFGVYARVDGQDIDVYLGEIVGISDFFDSYFSDYFFKY
jgi:hypothetical protein